MIRALRSLEGEIGNPNAASFEANLKNFSTGVKSADVRHLTSFHALTTAFEFFAVYLIFRVCRTGLVVPQSWIDIHLPRFVGNRRPHSSDTLLESSIHIYRRCLMDLTRDFAKMISGLDPFALPEIRKGFRLGIRNYPPRLLHRRNVELLSVAIVNLRGTGVDFNVNGAWAEVCKVNETRLPRFELRDLPSTRPSRFITSVPITFDTEPFQNSSRNWSSHTASTKVKTPSSSSRRLHNTTISKARCGNFACRLSRLITSFPRSLDYDIRRRLNLRLGQRKNTTIAISRRRARFSNSGDLYTPNSERSGTL